MTDTSTQSCKIVIRDYETGNFIRSSSADHLDGTECHPDNWWNAFQKAVAEVGGIDDVSAIAGGGQQRGMVLLDADGEITRPALLWNDTRSAVAACDLTSELGALTVVKSPIAHKDGKYISEIGKSAWAQAVGSVLVASITITKIAGSQPWSQKMRVELQQSTSRTTGCHGELLVSGPDHRG
ncbi:MAG: hypothetical protein LBP35_06730 [Candidatus Ancillula trichonymphae]|nr:hypothetical protein [Candidatus Ancillula trichonymphae]